jgi:hypothetical protein
VYLRIFLHNAIKSNALEMLELVVRVESLKLRGWSDFSFGNEKF